MTKGLAPRGHPAEDEEDICWADTITQLPAFLPKKAHLSIWETRGAALKTLELKRFSFHDCS